MPISYEPVLHPKVMQESGLGILPAACDPASVSSTSALLSPNVSEPAASPVTRWPAVIRLYPLCWAGHAQSIRELRGWLDTLVSSTSFCGLSTQCPL